MTARSITEPTKQPATHRVSQARVNWRERLRRHGVDREALLFEGRSISFPELSRDVDLALRRLDDEKIEAGDRIGLLAPPSLEGVVLIHALLAREAVMVPLNLRWTESELQSAAELAGLRWLVVADESVETGLAVASSTGCGLLRLGAAAGSPAEADLFERLRLPASSDAGEEAKRREAMCEQDGALVLFTSGTSGRPKGALLSHQNLLASAEGSISLLGSATDDRWLCCMPLFHIGGLSILIRSVLAGTSVVLHRRFDAEELSASLDHDRVTRVSLVAAMLSRLLEVRGGRRAPDTLRLVLLGGGPASQELLQRAHELGYPLAPTYGLTESASQVATRPPTTDPAPGADLAAGLVPIAGTEIRIVDPHGGVVPAGIAGEIEVRGPTVMRGYLGDPEATAQVLQNGWLATGDLGRLDAAGGLRVLDRRSDLILSGGENVYPAEIESVLVEHADVAEAGVVGVADDRYGERPRAYLVAMSGRTIDAAEILGFCAERLAKYKWPRDLIVLDELPRTASGKLLRRDLKARND